MPLDAQHRSATHGGGGIITLAKQEHHATPAGHPTSDPGEGAGAPAKFLTISEGLLLEAIVSELLEQFSPAFLRECVDQDIRKGIDHVLASS